MQIQPRCAHAGCPDSGGFHRLVGRQVHDKVYCRRHRHLKGTAHPAYVDIRTVRLRGVFTKRVIRRITQGMSSISTAR